MKDVVGRPGSIGLQADEILCLTDELTDKEGSDLRAAGGYGVWDFTGCKGNLCDLLWCHWCGMKASL